jgi:hypothetical protein
MCLRYNRKTPALDSENQVHALPYFGCVILCQILELSESHILILMIYNILLCMIILKLSEVISTERNIKTMSLFKDKIHIFY